MKYLLFLGLPLFALDQLTKWLVRQNVPYGAEIPIIPGFFSLVHASNTGAAFSLFTGNNVFFIGLAVAALAVILFLLFRGPKKRTPQQPLTNATKISFGLLASGILGNLTDRVLRGAVTDFLHFYIRQYAWPSFNIADSCICIAAGLLILASFQRHDAERKR
ncbi:MAG: signal peptidase II [Verrucomicrobia bacterium]|jgi:signal peptidase II|nr:signal peptidase II [Verrucomicrobiota bacterium]MBV8532637.1 signal peptidase II [Verrucomicrobiota bacterium]